MKAALKLVEAAPFLVNEDLLWAEDNLKGFHSLHGLGIAPDFSQGFFSPGLSTYFILRLTNKGEVVFDPFAKYGTNVAEAAIQGRIGIGCDIEPYSVRVGQAKLMPADITEVTLWLQRLQLKRPIDVKFYNDDFRPFYELETFRELINLQSELRNRNDFVSEFVEMVAATLLHGPSAGYLSAHSPSQFSLSPENQERLNSERRQYPDYRPIVPRILRKAAAVLRDGIPSGLRNPPQITNANSAKYINKQFFCDGRNVSSIATQSVDLIVSTPPIPYETSPESSWLKNWFLSLPQAKQQKTLSLNVWRDFMAEALFEMARVMKTGRRAVLDLREIVDPITGQTIFLEDEVQKIVDNGLSRLWDCESVSIQPAKFAQLKDCLKDRDSARTQRRNRLLVMRRR